MTPVIGDWYRDVGGALFEVVGVDDDLEAIEIQYFDGTVEEMYLDEWDEDVEAGDIVKTDPPEDW